MSLIRLLYVSRVATQVRLADAESIAADAATRNERVNVTGFLLYSPEFFVQVLEGPEPVLEATYRRIEQDQRHSDLRIISRTPIRQRAFEAFSMGFAQYGRFGQEPSDKLPEWAPSRLLKLLEAAAGD